MRNYLCAAAFAAVIAITLTAVADAQFFDFDMGDLFGGGGGGHHHHHHHHGGGGAAEYEEVDYYAELGLSRDASDAEIKRSFHKLSLKYHPDRNKNNAEAQQKFMKINEAHDVLSNPDKRSIYDVHGKRGLEKKDQHHPLTGQQMNKSPDYRAQVKVTLEDLYNGVRNPINFGRQVVCPKCRGTGAKGGKTKKCSSCSGKGVKMTVQQLAPGFNVQMQQTCEVCGGKGKVFKEKCEHCSGQKVVQETKQLELVVEKGMPDNHEIVFDRAGEQRPGTIPGDVILTLVTEEHQRFKRRGNDLLMSLPISLKEALLGFTKTLPHLDGHQFTINQRKKITKPNEILVIKQEGMPIHNFPSEKGNLEVQVQIDFPDSLTSQQQQQIKELFQ